MMRVLHRWPGLLAVPLMIALALGGAALSVWPMAARLAAPAPVAGQTVAELAALVQAAHPGVEQIRRAPSGQITAWWFSDGIAGAAVVDPVTGQDAGSADRNAVQGWLTRFHRSLLLDDAGRLVVVAGALVMLVLALSGMVLVARRVGGWRRWFAPQRGPLAGRLHTEIARIAVAGLLVSALTGLWMAGTTFDLLPDDSANPAFPAQVSGATGLSPRAMPALQAVPVTDLQELTFPAAGDGSDVFALTSSAGSGYVDQGTGALLTWAEPGPFARLGAWAVMLHTGQGAAVWGLVLGLAVAMVPVLALTGVLLWLQGAGRGRPRLRAMAPAAKAETVILVGSEGGTTWGFAATLARALQQAGQSVHVAPLSALDPARYGAARRLVVLAATWGAGDAPGSARGALDRLAAPPRADLPLVVLGFGDSGFPGFCAYAERFAARAQALGWPLLLPTARIDRQSPQDFARWGRDLGAALGLDLVLTHQPATRQTTAITLVSRRDFGQPVQAPAAILRFALPRAGLWQRLRGRGLGRFRAGDLLGIVPQGSALPRFYSLASGRADGFIEIAVRKQPGGLCSGQLLALRPGDSLQAFVQPNPGFQPGRGRAPLILIGAGTGLAPLVGFVRGQGGRRPIHLWAGSRDAQTDFLFGPELAQWQREGRLAGLRTAFSRSSAPRQYVQDALRTDAAPLRQLIARGARVMVCGGRDMAEGVRAALTDILAPAGLSPATLKAEGRYAEDVF